MSMGELAPNQVQTLPVPAAQAGSADVVLSLNVSSWSADRVGTFGFNRSCAQGCDPFVVTFAVGAADAQGDRTVKVSFPNRATPAPNCAGHYGIPHGCEPGRPRGAVRVLQGEDLTARFMTDGPLMEVFVQHGRIAAALFTKQVGALQNASALHVFNQGEGKVSELVASAWSMGCGWAEPPQGVHV
jgi:hypothetical protein